MTLLYIDELKNLIATVQTPCISLYIAMQKSGAKIRENPIRFKNAIREAEKRLDAIAMRHTEALNLLQPAMELDRNDFWEHQEQGLAVFISPGIFRYYCLPMPVPELVVVGKQFHVKPLLHLINSDRKFYLLTLAQQNVRFFEGNHYDMQEVTVENMPPNLEAVLLIQDNSEKGVQHRIATTRGGTANPFQHPGEFHGQGSPEHDRHQAGILQFSYAIDQALKEKLRDEQAPLILAGVEYLHPIYREANTYTHLLPEGITGNQELTDLKELHHQAWSIVAPMLEQQQQQAIALYQQLARENQHQTSADLKEIVPAAYYQKVDTLFISLRQQIWGKFDPDNMTVDLHPEPQPDDVDLLDFAAVHTFLNSGQVYILEAAEILNNQPVAAIFRY
ncbi:hypothetical protein CLI64_00820 [Nostoc sp. CENA543]|uniref:baeRF7 domain-containing protein n=1 Tax=Nostoc sp. CENA543 TaxID=1869241 RepID=UPI000CA3AF33|nr:hypothetical protein [Nostoc sp. CENA543]AUS99057.1 hypothetical protein CLI64_00820 [Nostoc sp. CENA543]